MGVATRPVLQLFLDFILALSVGSIGSGAAKLVLVNGSVFHFNSLVRLI